MEKFFSDEASKAIGPYSHAVKSGNILFCSGQTPLDPAVMKITAVTIEDQTARVLDNLELVLKSAGLSLANVVKTTVFLKNMEDFPGMNKVYEAKFGGNKPARSTIAVKQNPLDALVEIECVAEFPA